MGVVLCGCVFLYARDYLRANDLHKGEYYLLGLFGLLGMMIMMSANSLLTMYLGLETLALSMYALVAIDRKNVTSAESAMKYFVLGAIASGALLYGISWVYGVTGSSSSTRSRRYRRTRAERSAALVRPGFPDRRHRVQVWRGAVSHVAAGRVPGRSYAGDRCTWRRRRSWRRWRCCCGSWWMAWAACTRLGDMIMVVAVLSLLVGNIVAIAQTNIKRMLGYSTIAHVGFILLAFSRAPAEAMRRHCSIR